MLGEKNSLFHVLSSNADHSFGFDANLLLIKTLAAVSWLIVPRVDRKSTIVPTFFSKKIKKGLRINGILLFFASLI